MPDRRRMRSRQDSSDVNPSSSMTSTSAASGDDQEKRALRERITTLEKKVSDLESRLDVQQSRTGNVGGSLSDVLRDPSEKYTIESLKKAGIVGWPVVDGVRVLVPIYSLAKNTEGQLVCVVYAIMEVAKMVHTSYLVTTIPGVDLGLTCAHAQCLAGSLTLPRRQRGCMTAITVMRWGPSWGSILGLPSVCRAPIQVRYFAYV